MVLIWLFVVCVMMVVISVCWSVMVCVRVGLVVVVCWLVFFLVSVWLGCVVG